MPLLEQRRKTSAAASQPGLNLAQLTGLLGPQVWSLTALLFAVIGKHFSRHLTGLDSLSASASPAVLMIIAGSAVLGLLVPRPRVQVTALVLTAGLAFAFGGTEQLQRQGRIRVLVPAVTAPSTLAASEKKAVLRITSWPRQASRGWRAVGIILATEQGPGPGRSDRVMLRGKGSPPRFWELLQASVTFTIPAEGDLPGSFDYREFLAGRAIGWTGSLDTFHSIQEPSGIFKRAEEVRNALGKVIGRILPAREARLAQAVLLGERTSLSRLESEAFTDLGLAHLFAVSGLHVGVLLGMVLLPGRILHLGPWNRFLPALIFLPWYALLTGFSGSVVRAAGLAVLALLSCPVGRAGRPLRFLGLLFWMTTMLQPCQVLDAGVRLSYLAAAGIVASLRLTGPLVSKPRPLQFLAGGLQVSLSAQWATLPQVALSFGRFSPFSPLTNLIVVPLFGIGVWFTVLAMALEPLWTWPADALAAWAFLVFRGLAAGVAWFSLGPGDLNLGLAPTGPALLLVWLCLVTLMIGLGKGWFLPDKRTGRLVMAVVLWGVGHGAFHLAGRQLLVGSQPLVCQFDVGQGDCGLIHFPDGASYIIDTGGTYAGSLKKGDGPVSRSVVPFLKRAGVNRLQGIILSHGHRDHTAGAPILAAEFSVESWIGGGSAPQDLSATGNDGTFLDVRSLGNIHSWRDWSLDLHHPRNSPPEGFHENDLSLVLILSRRGHPQYVWSGDLETEGEQWHLVEGHVPGPTTVWKAGHHGSNTSGSQPWIQRLSPALILVSCGVGNRYGHPNHGPYVTREEMIPVLRTDQLGTLVVRWNREGMPSLSTGRRWNQNSPFLDTPGSRF